MRARSQTWRAERPQHSSVLYDTCVQSHLWVASGVSALAAFASRRLEIETSPAALSLVFSSTLLIYNLDTVLDLRSELAEAVGLEHSEQLRARERRAKWLVLGSLLCLTVLCGTSSWQTALLIGAGAAFSCLYAVPLGPQRLRLKALPGIKSLVVGVSVAVAAVSVPLVQQNPHPESWCCRQALTTLALIATLTFINATLFDVRDLDQDGPRGLRTLPVVLGVTATRRVLTLIALLGFGAAVLADAQLWVQGTALLTLLVPMIRWFDPASPPSAYAWLVDGALFIPWLLT